MRLLEPDTVTKKCRSSPARLRYLLRDHFDVCARMTLQVDGQRRRLSRPPGAGVIDGGRVELVGCERRVSKRCVKRRGRTQAS